MPFDFKARRVVVAGGSRGIGRAIALNFASAGADVSICARGVAALEATRAEIAAHGHKSHAATCDLADAASVSSYVAAAAQALGGIDVLVNNAGYAYRAEIGSLDLAAMRAMFETNVFGLVDITNRVVPHLKAQAFGDIVNLASTSGMKGAATGTAYSGSKWAVRGITQCWQAELRPHNIRVSCICPSEVQTNFGGRAGRNNPNKLYAADIAATILAGLHLPQRVLWTELAVFATNPWKEE